MERGTRLPSSRMMARLMGVSRNTVLAAYESLAADDLVQGERGAATRVKAGGVTGMRAIGLRHVIREARYPTRTVSLTDPDGTPLYLNF
jgi:DNA-binding FadR family transcriptional regulator